LNIRKWNIRKLDTGNKQQQWVFTTHKSFWFQVVDLIVYCIGLSAAIGLNEFISHTCGYEDSRIAE